MRMKKAGSLVAFLLAVSSLQLCCQALSMMKCEKNNNFNVIAFTKLGKIQGTCDFVEAEGRTGRTSGYNVLSWLGIPYAKAPVDERRFRAPEPVEPWEGTLEAKKPPNSCMQIVSQSSPEATNTYRLNTESRSKPSEDCLYLNVFSPAEAFYNQHDMNNPNYKSPVMVFFPGVGYTKGSSVLDIYDPSVFAALSNVIVVTFNYRLGVFGFLHYSDNATGEGIEGNQGLLDQHMALKWVSDNIEAFGGDPAKITVAGQGVGGVLASFHLFYKPSWPLFRNMILQSASPLNPVLAPISSEQASKRAKVMFTMLKCQNKTALACAQFFDANILLNASTHLFNTVMLKGNRDASSYLRSAFKPVIDRRFFTSSPKDLLYSGQYKSCNILTGFTGHEGSIQLPRTSVCPNKYEDCQQYNYTSEMVDFLSKYYEFYPDWPGTNKTPVYAILSEYTGMSPEIHKNPKFIKKGLTETLEKIIGEELVVCPVKRLAEIVSRRSKVFVYRFEHRISTSLWPSSFGSVHGDELAMTLAHTLANSSSSSSSSSSFNVTANPWLPQTPATYTEEEKALSKEILGLWITFIRTDDPNSPYRFRAFNSDKNWPEFAPLPTNGTKSQRKFGQRDGWLYVLKANGTKALNTHHSDECDVWKNIEREFSGQTRRPNWRRQTSTATTKAARNESSASTWSQRSQTTRFKLTTKTETKPTTRSTSTKTTTTSTTPTTASETVEEVTMPTPAQMSTESELETEPSQAKDAE